MKFKKGDTVYAIDLKGNVFKSTIKCVHRKDQMLPYELDLKTKARFYPEAELFETKQEAIEFVSKDQMKAVQEALDHPAENKSHRFAIPAVFTEDSMSGCDGKMIPINFQLSDKEKEELNLLCAKLDMYCALKSIPYMMCIITANDKDGKGVHLGTRRTACFPGPRTPDWLRSLWKAMELYLKFMGGEPEN